MANSSLNRDELPDALDPKHIQSILNIGRRKTYELLNDQNVPFRVIRVGNLIKVPKSCFFKWFDGE